MAKTEKTEKKIIVRRVRPVNYSSRNLTISIVIIVLVFMIQVFLFFYLNIGVLSVLFIGILFLFMYMLLLLTLLNPFVIGDGIKHLIIQRSEISNIKNKVSESENTKEKNETDEHGLKEIVKEKVKRAIDLKRYGYVGSLDTKVYHRNSCRFAKTISKDYIDFNNNKDYFKNKGYKPCLVCIETK